MFLRALTDITIKQIPSDAYPTRKTILNFDFCNEFECEDSWQDLTNKGVITLPKNLYVRNERGKFVSLGTEFGKPVSNINIGGFSTGIPLLLRGDEVTIAYGYKYFNAARQEVVDKSQIFSGFISNVTSKKPLVFEIEDNMWKLKQIQAPIKTFTSEDKLEDILRFLLKGTSFTVNALTQTTFGNFRTGNETVAECLARLRRLYNFESYFRGNELRSGAQVYIESEAKEYIFKFQENIITDELEYRRKDDVILSAVARNTIEQANGTTKDGFTKTKKVRLEVLVTLQPDGSVVQFAKTKNVDYPPNTGGERRTFIFPGAKSISDLVALAKQQLLKYYYTGFRGSFTTFGIPYIRQGDNVRLIDPVLPERNGLYKVKRVKYSGGVNGQRQIIYLDFKLN